MKNWILAIKNGLLSKPTYIIVAIIVTGLSTWWGNNQFKLYKLQQFEIEKKYEASHVDVIVKQNQVSKEITKREYELVETYQEVEEELKLNWKEKANENNEDFYILGSDNNISGM